MSSVLFGVVTLVGCGVVVYLLRTKLNRRHALVATVAVLGWVSLVPLVMIAPVLSESREPVPLEKVSYRTSISCKKCHAEQYETWYKSFHRSMTQDPWPENVLGDFDDVTLTFKGFECRLFRRDDRYFMNLIESEWESAVLESGGVPSEISNPPRVTYSVDRLVGSHNMQVYLTKLPNGEYWSLPLVWHQTEARWVTREGSFLASPSKNLYSFTMPWNNNCAFCHNTKNHPGLLVDPQAPLERYAFQTRLEEMGIACEACHGPGDQHVRANRNPGRRFVLRETGRSDPTIVNPAKLSQKSSLQVCGRCHGRWRAKDELTREWLSTGDFFVPGGEFLEKRYCHNFSFPTIDGDDAEPEVGFFWEDWTPQASAMESQGLELSACFKGGELTCISCHTMHGPDPVDQLKFPDDEGVPTSLHNAACLECHEQFSRREALVKHTHHAPDSSGSRCFNCHMPYQTFGLLTAIRTHRISSPNATKTAQIGLPNACNQCHIDQSLSWAAKRLGQWYDHEVPALPEEEQQRSETVVELFRGHALNRALAASRLGWQSANEAAPGNWPVPLLVRSLVDQYAAVRFVAYRSLRAFPGFENTQFDYQADEKTRIGQILVILDLWRALPDKQLPNETRPILLDGNGWLDEEQINPLLQQQDQTEYEIFE